MAAVTGFIGGCTSGFGDPERIVNYWAAAEITGDGPAQITEVIDYDFGGSERRGIFRDVPGLDPDAPITVASATAPDELLVTGDGFGDTRIRIGDPDITIDTRHRYRIEYPIGVDQPDGRISWNAVGDRWQVKMDNVEVHLLADRELTDVQCSQGPRGAWGGCTATEVAPGHLMVELDGVAVGEGVTVSAMPGQPLAAVPQVAIPEDRALDDPGAGILTIGGTAIAGFLAAAAVASRFVRRAGREWVWDGGSADAAFGPQFGDVYPTRRVDHDELNQLASTEFAPPKDLTAWQGGVLYHEAVDGDQQVAWLLEQAIDEQVVIEGTVKDPSIRLIPTGGPIDPHLAGLFGGRLKVDLDGYDKQFATGWDRLENHLDQWHRDSPYWDPAGDRNRKVALGTGAVIALVGAAATIGSAIAAAAYGTLLLIGVALGAALVGVGLAMMTRSWELRIRTAEGSGLWILIESFRRFIENSDAQHVEDAAKRGVLLDYTAWAVALGEADSWSKAVKSANLDQSVAGHQALFLTSMAPGLSSATAVTSTKPSSSGSGGGGGGSVGGGGGGGGGGSW